MIRDGIVITTKCVSNTCTCSAFCCEECCRCDLTENYFEIDVTEFSEYALAVPLDSDGDTVPDDFDGEMDNCPYTENPNQENCQARKKKR